MSVDIQNKKILITGGSGSLAKQIVFELDKRKIKPIVHLRESSDSSYIDSFQLEKRIADLRRKDQISAIMKGIDYVIHTAAMVDFRGNQLTQFTGINTMGAVLMYEAAVKAGVKRFVHVSTVGAIGAINRRTNGTIQDYHLADENAEFNLSKLKIPYIMTKRAAELELNKLSEKSETELITVNPSIIASPTEDDRQRIGKYFSKLIIPEIPVRVNIVDLRDVAPGVIAALEKGKPDERYILGGDNITVRELVLAGSTIIGKIPHLVRIPRRVYGLTARFAEVMYRVTGRRRVRLYPDLVKLLDYDWAFSSKKAHDELGYRWRSIHTTLENMLTNNMVGSWLKPLP